MNRALPVVALLWLSACATAQVAVPPNQVAALERQLVGEQRFLRVSMYQTPFFSDATRKLITGVPPELVRSLEDTQGKPINPGPVERIWPAGTLVKIRKVEFPSAMVMSQRVLYTPRSLVWVTLEIDGAPRNAPAVILVMRPGIRSQDEFTTELERSLSRESQTRRLDGFTDSVREAVRTKTAIAEMPSEALEMAWGYPESKRIELIGTQKKETWRWADGGRTAVVIDGKAASFSGASGASSSSSP